VAAHGANGRNGARSTQSGQGASFKVASQTLQFQTKDAPDFIDLTDAVVAFVKESGVTAGQVLIYSRHTTAAIKINENEPLLLRDVAHFLDRAAPKDAYYGHNDFAIRTVNMHDDECPNGHSHCQHMILGTSETVPVIDGKPTLGQFQRIFLIELDRPITRSVIVQVMGI
jgi:secondary thiamine-phosphate synthase enzyme